MAVDILNPDSLMLQQVDGQWQQLMTVVLWKLAPQGVTITHEDLARAVVELEDKVLLTHGHQDSIEFRLIPRTQAERMARSGQYQTIPTTRRQ